jgi:hypothetical protein
LQFGKEPLLGRRELAKTGPEVSSQRPPVNEQE